MKHSHQAATITEPEPASEAEPKPLRSAVDLGMEESAPPEPEPPGEWSPIPSQESRLIGPARAELRTIQKAKVLSDNQMEWLREAIRELTRAAGGMSATELSNEYLAVERRETLRQWGEMRQKYSLPEGCDDPAPLVTAHAHAKRLRQEADTAAAAARSAENEAEGSQIALKDAHKQVGDAASLLNDARVLAGQYASELRQLRGSGIGIWIPADARREPTYARIALLKTMVAEFPNVERLLTQRLEDAKSRFAELKGGLELVA